MKRSRRKLLLMSQYPQSRDAFLSAIYGNGLQNDAADLTPVMQRSGLHGLLPIKIGLRLIGSGNVCRGMKLQWSGVVEGGRDGCFATLMKSGIMNVSIRM